MKVAQDEEGPNPYIKMGMGLFLCLTVGLDRGCGMVESELVGRISKQASYAGYVTLLVRVLREGTKTMPELKWILNLSEHEVVEVCNKAIEEGHDVYFENVTVWKLRGIE